MKTIIGKHISIFKIVLKYSGSFFNFSFKHHSYFNSFSLDDKNNNPFLMSYLNYIHLFMNYNNINEISLSHEFNNNSNKRMNYFHLFFILTDKTATYKTKLKHKVIFKYFLKCKSLLYCTRKLVKFKKENFITL